MKQHLLSIVIPCYNCQKTLEEAVASCYEQGLADDEFEVVMVDDASTDGTATLIEKLAKKYPNIRLVRHEANRGGGAARNTGIKAAKGDLIYCLDSDNFFGPGQPLRAMRDFLIQQGLDGASFYERRFFIGSDAKHYNSYFNQRLGVNMQLGNFFEKDSALLDNFLYTKASYLRTKGYPEHHGFDTQTFEIRWISAGNRARVCPHTVFYHRTAVGKGSYFEREYDKGNFSKNYYLIIEEIFSLLSPKAKDTILHFDIFKRSSMADNLLRELKKLHTNGELLAETSDMSIGSILAEPAWMRHYESSLKSYSIATYEDALREADAAITSGLDTKIARYHRQRCILGKEGVPPATIDRMAAERDVEFDTARQRLYRTYHRIPIANRLITYIQRHIQAWKKQS